MAHNFQQWNPGAVNQENDAAYTSDTLRSGGAPTGSVFPSPTANKLFYQISIMAFAIAQMMTNKGYSTSDANATSLAATLGNLITNNDIPGHLVQFTDFSVNPGGALSFNVATKGHIALPGLIIQWGNVLMPGSGSSDNPTSFNFDIAFPHACLVCVPGTFSPTADRITFIKSVTTAGGVMSNNGSAANATYIAIGY